MNMRPLVEPSQVWALDECASRPPPSLPGQPLSALPPSATFPHVAQSQHPLSGFLFFSQSSPLVSVLCWPSGVMPCQPHVVPTSGPCLALLLQKDVLSPPHRVGDLPRATSREGKELFVHDVLLLNKNGVADVRGPFGDCGGNGWSGRILGNLCTHTDEHIHKNTCVCECVSESHSRLTLCDPMYYSPSGFSVHGILQARTLEWVAMPSSWGSF